MKRTHRARLLGFTALIFGGCALPTVEEFASGTGAGLDAGVEDAPVDAVAGDTSSADVRTDAARDAEVAFDCNQAGLVAYWPLDEGSGLIAADCRNLAAGMLAGDARWGVGSPSGDSGASLLVNGLGSVDLPLAQAHLHLVPPFTVAFWSSPAHQPQSFGDVVVRFDATGAWAVGMTDDQRYGANFFLDSGTIFPIRSAATFTLGAWRHVALTVEPSQRIARLYVGGILEQSVIVPEAVPVVDTNVRLARNGGNFSGYAGRLARIALFARALSDGEVAALAKP